MICFHFTIFVVLGTTFVSSCFDTTCCDLLSFYYLCRTRNNAVKKAKVEQTVVICFHFTIFVVLGTTGLCDIHFTPGCDLLSFYYLCRTRNNVTDESLYSSYVVICFHFTIFVVLGTTRPAFPVPGRRL